MVRGKSVFLLFCVLGLMALFSHSALGQTQLIQNGGFESGSGDISTDAPPWEFDGNFALVYHDDSFLAHSGKGVAKLAGHTSAEDFVVQKVSLPTGFQNITMTFYLDILQLKPTGQDKFFAAAYDVNTGRVLRTLASFNDNQTDSFFPFGKVTIDLTDMAGQTVFLGFEGRDGDLTDTTFFVDDVSVIAGNIPAGQDFSLSLTPSTLTVLPGDTANYTLDRMNINGFNAGLEVSIDGLPPNSTQGLPQTFNFPVTLPIITTSATPPGTYTISVTGKALGLTRSTTATLIVADNSPSIAAATFDGKKLLSVVGHKFGVSPLVRINGQIVTAKVLQSTDVFIELKGKPAKLHLVKGSNSVQVINQSGVVSNTVTVIY